MSLKSPSLTGWRSSRRDSLRTRAMAGLGFGFSSLDEVACIGTGTMDEVWHGALYTMPFLYVGSWRRIVTWIRQFATHRPRRFDAYMVPVNNVGVLWIIWARTSTCGH